MAEITYDPTPADNPEFTAEELDSLQVGEQMQQAEEQLLAGKYRNAEQLEQAYLELQSKLGQGAQPESDSDEVQPDAEEAEYEEAEEETEWSETAVTMSNAAAEFYQNGELSSETMEKFSEFSSEELVNAYLQHFANPETPDLTDSQVNQIKNFAGGESEYNQLTSWAADNMDSQYNEAFNKLVDQGDLAAIQLAVAGLMATYQESNGYEGRMLSGRAAQETSLPVFRSQAEVVAAMSDPRYDSDPAYRQDVFEALERSNIQY